MKIKGITKNVVVLGWVSFFTDLASEMLYPIMPLFLVSLPNGSAQLLGLIDGIAEGISSGLRWIGGALSDRFQRRKPFIFAGYGLSAISKPIMGLAGFMIGWPLFLLGRASDRLGKSIRTAARDALIADSTDPAYRGVAFGFHRAMDTTGAILGPLLTLGLVVWMVGPHMAFSAKWLSEKASIAEHLPAIQNIPMKWLFVAALVPGLISAFLTLTSIREIAGAAGGNGKPPAIWQVFPKPFWHLMLANFIFSLGNSSDSFLILRSGEIGLAFGFIIIVYALYNAVYAAGSTPLGKLSDIIGRKKVVISGWITYALVYAGFSYFRSPLAPWILFAAYGLYQAFAEGVTKAMVSDVVPKAQRAGAIGMFYTGSGIGQLFGSILAGMLWQHRWFNGQVMPSFAIGSIFALIAVPIIATVRTKQDA